MHMAIWPPGYRNSLEPKYPCMENPRTLEGCNVKFLRHYGAICVLVQPKSSDPPLVLKFIHWRITSWNYCNCLTHGVWAWILFIAMRGSEGEIPDSICVFNVTVRRYEPRRDIKCGDNQDATKIRPTSQRWLYSFINKGLVRIYWEQGRKYITFI